MGWINHPASNINPEFRYFKIDAYLDCESSLPILGTLTKNEEGGVTPTLKSVIVFPKDKEDGMECLDIVLKNFQYEEITDDILVTEEGISFDRINIPNKSIRLGSDYMLCNYIDTKEFYTNEIKDMTDYINNQEKMVLNTKNIEINRKKEKIKKLLDTQLKIKHFLDQYSDNQNIDDIDIDSFPMEFLDKPFETKDILQTCLYNNVIAKSKDIDRLLELFEISKKN